MVGIITCLSFVWINTTTGLDKDSSMSMVHLQATGQINQMKACINKNLWVPSCLSMFPYSFFINFKDGRNDPLGHVLEDSNLAVCCGILYLIKSDGIYMLKT